MRFETLGQLADTLKGVVRIADGEVTILTRPPIRDGLIDLLADAALQGARPELRATARWLIKKLAPQMGVIVRAGLPDRSDSFRRVAVSCAPESLYPSLRDRFRSFLGEKAEGLEVVEGDLSPAGTQAAIDAVAVAAAIREDFGGALYRPEFSETPWRLFAVRSQTATNRPAVEKTLWEELLSAQTEGTSGVVVRVATDAGSR